MTDSILDKVLGCVIGATIGDSVGGPIEFSDAKFVRWSLDGKDWLEDMRPYKGKKIHPFGIWRDEAPRGTGTDDTRLNQIFLNCVVRNRGVVNPQLLATEYIYQYQNFEKHYEKTLKLARQFYGDLYSCFCAFLGVNDPQIYQGLPLHVAQNPPGAPGIVGLLTLQSAGLLYPDDPEGAYKKTFELSILDMGYAKDATALMAATVSAALGNKTSAKDIIDIGINTNPYGFGNRETIGFRFRRMTNTLSHFFPEECPAPSLPRFFKIADEAENERELMIALAKECKQLHPYDPLDVLGVPLAVIRYHKGDPVRSILTAANHRWVNDQGDLIKMRDVDCVAMVTGVLVGAINGLSAFPKDWVRDVIQANIDVYGFNIEKNARDFYRVVYQGQNVQSKA